MQNAYHLNHKAAKTVLHVTVATRDKDAIQEQPEALLPMEEEEVFYDVQVPNEDYSQMPTVISTSIYREHENTIYIGRAECDAQTEQFEREQARRQQDLFQQQQVRRQQDLFEQEQTRIYQDLLKQDQADRRQQDIIKQEQVQIQQDIIKEEQAQKK